MKDNINRNGSGCKDPTAAQAIKNTSEDQKRVGNLMNCLNYICKIAGFKIEGRVVLCDLETGKVWR